jgi:Rieske Fe-S protein
MVVRFFTETHAQEINSSGIVTSDGYKIDSKNIVVATNAPVSIDEKSKIYDKQEPYRTCVIGAQIKKGSITKALYWDTGDHNSKNSVPPYHYVRIQNMDNKNNKNDLLIIGGEDHKTGGLESNPEDRFDKLIVWARARFPIEDIIYHWSGQVMEPKGSMAFIGHNSNDANNVYIATGDSGNGMTHGTIAGVLLTDMILGKENQWASLYDPSREIKENNNSESDNTNTKGEEHNKGSLGEISTTQGDVIEEIINGKKTAIAVYKDERDDSHVYSGVCTHLGCTVAWNPLEKSFDCPCHRSRFSGSSGRVINGPANSNLERKNANKKIA